MRHKGVDKEETRRKIVEAASRSFRKYGYAGIGVDAVAKAAGVTSGAFYAHMGSKNAAFGVALETGLEEVIEGIPIFQRDHGADWVNAFAEYYLGKIHRNDLECGCAMASLTSEVVRSNSAAHVTYEKKMSKIAGLVTQGLAGGTDEERRARAWSMLGILIGGINLVRAMKSVKAIEEVSGAIKTAAVKAAGRAQSVV